MTNDILLTKHFKLSEFEASRKAVEHGIVNIAPPEAVENLRRLCEGCLEPLREALGLPVVVTSGYRTKELNNLLAHSSDRSQHMLGQAADFHVGLGPEVQGSKFKVQGSKVQGSKFKVQSRRELLIKAFRLIIESPDIDYDQLIIYPTFIHVSFVSKERNRRGILLGRGDGKLGYGRITRADALKIV